VLQAPKAPRVLLVIPDHKDRKVLQALKDPKDQLVQLLLWQDQLDPADQVVQQVVQPIKHS
jgi:hypothetical protein